MTHPEAIGVERMIDKLHERSGFMREVGHNDDAELDDEAASIIQRLTEENEALRKERDRCHTRLEIDRVWVMGDNDDSDLDPRDIPVEERGEIPDGIECRDATIYLLEQDAIADKARIKALEEAQAAGVEHIETLSELLKIIKEHWIDYDHVFSIAVHEADQFAAARALSTESQSK